MTWKTTHILPCLLLWLLICSAPALAEDGRTQVLYLNSYQNGYAWSDNILKGIRSTFRDSQYVVDLQVEYMDAKKHPEPENREILRQLFENKFRSTKFDAIICSDNDAFQFMLAYHEQLFPSVPVIFCGVNDFDPQQLAAHDLFTGVVEELDISYNLNLALTINPDKKRVVVVSDSSLSSSAIVAQIKKAMPDFDHRLSFDFWENLPLDELLEKSRSMPEDSFLFFVPFYIERGGKYLSAADVVEALYANANVPIYGAWSFLLGHGIVGGRLLDGKTHGKVTAEMVLDILDGKPVPNLLTKADEESPITFDWQVLERFELTHASLPENAVFINQPEPTYRFEKGVVWTALALLFLLTAFTVFLVASRTRAIRAEQELALSRKMLRSIIDTMPQLIYWKDLNSRFVGANRRFADFFNLSDAESVQGKSNRDLLKGESISREGERLDQKVIESNAPVLHEIIDHDGPSEQDVIFEINKVPLHDDNGQVTGILTTAEDITARVQLERQLMQSQKLEAIGTFVGGIAHDFNNLLTTIINSTELALMDADGPVAEDVQRAKAAAEHGSRLVGQILTYARPSNEGTVLVAPSAPVNEALDLISHMLPDNIQLHATIPEDLGTGMADPAHLQQILMNLCTNSIHAMRARGGELHVSMDVVAQDGADRSLWLRVRDAGPGIPDTVMERIFDPFFTTKDKQEGTGLGLAIVHGIVQVHGGDISLSSQPGETIFEIHLPFPAGQGEGMDRTQADTNGVEHILFVEDDPEQLNLIPRSLRRMGYTVTTAAGGQEALDLVMGGAVFDIVVTDFDMPGHNGVELSRTLHQLHPQWPVILVSGGRDALSAAQGERGIAQIVVKPYTGSSLAAAIRETLGQTSVKEEAQEWQIY